MRAYKLFLYFYPAAFRSEYEGELCDVFQQKRHDVTGFFSVLMFYLREVGDVLQNAIRVHWDMLQRDIGYTLRMAFRKPGFAVTVILITSLGIGANTAVFSVVNHVLLRPLPYQDPDRIVRIWESHSYYANEASPPNFRDWKQRSRSFEQIAAYSDTSMNLVGNGRPERIDGAIVTADLLPLLGVQPAIGRLFMPQEDRHGAGGTVLISFSLWQSRFASSAKVLGQSIRLNDQPYIVIGVLPRGFTFPDRKTSIWIPFRFDPKDDDFQDRNNNWLDVIARLKSGVTLEQAREEMAVIAKVLEREYPVENAESGVLVQKLHDGVPRQSRLLLAALLGASLCVLLIACTNLANLFLVRAMGRRRELTVRAALGAGRERLVRQLLTESMVLAFAGAVLGVYIAHISVPLLSRLIPTFLPVGDATVLDVRVLGFTALLVCITSIGFGVLPAMQICSRAGSGSLREGPRSTISDRKDRMRSLLVMAEVTATVILLITSGLLIRAFWRIQSVDPGFNAENVWTMQTPLPFPKYESTVRRVDFYSRVLLEIRALPEVSNAAYISFLPMTMGGGIWPVVNEGGIDPNPGNPKKASLRFITPGLFDTLKIPIQRGRDVNESDTIDSPFVAVVSESFIQEVWPGSTENPLGRRIHFAFKDRTIVGVVRDIRVRGLEQESEPQVYLPYRQVADGSLVYYVPQALVIRKRGDDEKAPYEAARSIIQEIDPAMPIAEARTLQDIVDGDTASRATQIRIMITFALLSLLLAGIGIHGLLSFTVSQRIPEFGVRIALGARSNDIVKIVLNKGFQVAAAGSFLGMLLAYSAGCAMQALLAGIKPADLNTFLVSSIVALLMTVSGCLVPAWRAVRVDPAQVMRNE